MGYYSEVGVLFTCPDGISGEKIIEELKAAWGNKDWDSIFSVKSFWSLSGKYEFVYVRTKNDIKWYESFPEIKGFVQYLCDWDRYETGGYHFIRLGEHIDDVEEYEGGCPENYIEVHRQMFVDTGD